MSPTPEQLSKIKAALYLAGFFAENPTKEQTANDRKIVKEAWDAFREISCSYEALTDDEKAFMCSFKETHGQYDIPDKTIIAYLAGSDNHFMGYTQLADARNLWDAAINFAKEL